MRSAAFALILCTVLFFAVAVSALWHDEKVYLSGPWTELQQIWRIKGEPL